MSKVLSLFNHKGGVSKTTTTFNLGWALAQKGYRTLLVDGDPQCNLTGTILGYSGHEDLADFYEEGQHDTIYDSLEPFFNGRFSDFETPNIQATSQENLFLLPGHIDFAEYETQISVALSTSQSLKAIQNLPGTLRYMIDQVSSKNDIDIVLIDMSPSVGATNQCFLMSSDYFLVPTSPDFYCKQAINSLARVLPRWNEDIGKFRNNKAVDFQFGRPPQFIGMISQKYRPRDGVPAKSFQAWIDKIKDTVDSDLLPILEKKLSHKSIVLPCLHFQMLKLNNLVLFSTLW
jgi:cellulose biosynthesis protein BcsQ